MRPLRARLRPSGVCAALALLSLLSSSCTAARATHHFSARDSGTTVDAKIGERLVVELSSPRGVAPEYRFEWDPQPVVDGAALRLVEHRVDDPGGDIDGGSFTHRYRFEAVAVGRSALSIRPRPLSKGGGEDAPTHPWVLTVDVAE